METTGIVVGLILLDFVCSVFSHCLDNISRFKMEEFIDRLKKLDSRNMRVYDTKKEAVLSFLGTLRLKHLTFMLTASLLDLAVVLLLVLLFFRGGGGGWNGGLVFVAAGYLLLVYVLDGVVPLVLAERHAESVVFNNVRAIRFLFFLLAPVGGLAWGIDTLVRRVVRRNRLVQDEEEEVEDEIKESVSEGVEDGILEEEEKKMIESVLKFDDADVKAIMTPRTEIVSIPVTASLDEAVALVVESGYSRIPAYGKNIDDIKGVLYAKDLLRYAARKESDGMTVGEMIREAYFIPESKMISDLFREIREKKNHFAVVLDEYGGTSGIVTAEDIVEEIVGDIEDEYDEESTAKFRRVSEQCIEVDARIDIEELNELMDLSLPEDEDFESLGGFLSSEMGKIPQVGDTFTYGDVVFKILRGTKRRALWVEVRRTDTTAGEE